MHEIEQKRRLVAFRKKHVCVFILYQPSGSPQAFVFKYVSVDGSFTFKKSNTKGVFNIDLVLYELMHLEECIIVLFALSDIEAMLPNLR